MPDPARHVAAVFGGKEAVFRIDKEDLRLLEAAIGGSAYQVFKRFTYGVWTIRDLEMVLTVALMHAATDRTARVQYQMARKMLALGHEGSSLQRDRWVSEVLSRNPPAFYAALAVKVLEAALFGLDPALASFDENTTREDA